MRQPGSERISEVPKAPLWAKVQSQAYQYHFPQYQYQNPTNIHFFLPGFVLPHPSGCLFYGVL